MKKLLLILSLALFSCENRTVPPLLEDMAESSYYHEMVRMACMRMTNSFDVEVMKKLYGDCEKENVEIRKKKAKLNKLVPKDLQKHVFLSENFCPHYDQLDPKSHLNNCIKEMGELFRSLKRR